MYSKKEILKYLKNKKSDYFEKFNINKLGIFGSYARGTQTKDSDIDILIDFLEVTGNLYDIKNEIKKDIKHELNLKADVCRETTINPHFRALILSEAIYV
jgi:predicted nucleotidyltransferase